MGKTIIAEDLMQSYINGLLTSQQNSDAIGLVVGQSTSQKDYAVYLVPTPPEEGEEEPEEESEEDKEEPTQSILKLDDVSEHWVAEHARQVTRMLPGGLSITGIYAYASGDVMKNAQAKLRQVLFATYKAIRKHDVFAKRKGKDVESLDWTVLQIDATTRKLTCRVTDVADPKSTARPADWKYQSFVNKWPYLECRVHVDITVPLKNQAQDCSQYSKQLSTTLTPFVDIIYNSIAVINGELKNVDDALEAQQSKRKQGKKGGGGGGSGDSSSYSVELLAQNPLSSNDKVTISKCSACSHVHGAIHSRAYVHNKATVKEAIHAVKADVVRSLQSRFELLSEDLRQSSSEKEVKELEIAPPTLIATPRRLFTKLPGTHISICDYVFKDETAQDSLDRLQELFSLKLVEEDLEFGAEHLPDDSELEAAERSCESQASEDSASEIVEENTKGKKSHVVGAAVGIAGAVVAAALSYLAMNQE
ncbi:protein odr-4 homolog [Amphiura filiformis]|uniref:protein odr-4 homolog n=1 Tax=Amphiura filiformis TaxID=82378 RepID=UPI003B21B4F4